MYMIRLDDASEYWHKAKWHRMSELLDRYGIKPIFGIIPENQDPQLLKYTKDETFWDTVSEWLNKGYTPALHSDTHIYCSNCAGMNPVNGRSEFAGIPLEQQREKIRCGNSVLLNHDIHAEVFFALAHTFDQNTLEALRQETNIRIICDTIATDIYYENGFYFIPQQTGNARKLPFKTVTFCYHPNTMSEKAFSELESFLSQNRDKFTEYSKLTLKERNFGILDWTAKQLYFGLRKLKKLR